MARLPPVDSFEHLTSALLPGTPLFSPQDVAAVRDRHRLGGGAIRSGRLGHACARRVGFTVQVAEMTPGDARTFWKALMGNAADLIDDAHALLAKGSFGRARSLTVLAQEELGKALWIYDTFSQAWSEVDPAPRTVDALQRHGRSHTQKYMEAFIFSGELASFWGDYSSYGDWSLEPDAISERLAAQREEAKETALAANLAKQRGFYVDRDLTGRITSPADEHAGTVAEDLTTAAQVVEMSLITDHTRMKTEASTPYDSTHEHQYKLLPVSHAVDWAAASPEFREASSGSPTRDGEAAEPEGDEPTGRDLLQ